MTLALTPDVTLTDVENGLVLLDQRNGRYWHLNGTGATALRMLLDAAPPRTPPADWATRPRTGPGGPLPMCALWWTGCDGHVWW